MNCLKYGPNFFSFSGAAKIFPNTSNEKKKRKKKSDRYIIMVVIKMTTKKLEQTEAY